MFSEKWRRVPNGVLGGYCRGTRKFRVLGGYCQIPDELVIDRVLQSLPPSYKGFVLNYNMQGMLKSLSELFALLKSAEVEI
jgi:hypothetical protein